MNGSLGIMQNLKCKIKNWGSRIKIKIRRSFGPSLTVVLIALVSSLLIVTMAEATVWYFRDSSQSVPANGPKAHQTTDSFTGGTWADRLMTLAQGATAETSSALIDKNQSNVFYRGTTFVSGATSSQTFTADQTWTVHLNDYVSSNKNFTIRPRIYIYEWSPVNNRAWVANYNAGSTNSFSVINGASDAVDATVNPSPAQNGASGVGLNPTTNKVYVSNYGSDSVQVIDARTNQTLTTITTTDGMGDGPHGVGVNASTNKIYIACYNSHNVKVINGSTDTVSATVSVGTNPRRVGVNPTTNKIYVANSNGNNVSVIDGSTDTVLTTVSVGTLPFGVGVNATTNKIYVSNNTPGTVSVINGSTDTVSTTVTVGTTPYEVGANATTNKIYVANYGSNNVSVIDGSTDTVSTTVPVGANPFGVGVNPTTNKIYVSNTYNGAGGNTVSVIDGSTDTVSTTVSVGVNPRAIAINPNAGPKGDVFLNPTDGADITWDTNTSQDISSSSGLAGTLDAGNYLCVDVYWNVVSIGINVRTVYAVWGDASSNSNLTSPGSEVPTLGFMLLLLAFAFFVLLAIKRGNLRLQPLAMGLLLLLTLSLVTSTPARRVSTQTPKRSFYVTVRDKSSKEISRFPLRPVKTLDEEQIRR